MIRCINWLRRYLLGGRQQCQVVVLYDTKVSYRSFQYALPTNLSYVFNRRMNYMITSSLVTLKQVDINVKRCYCSSSASLTVDVDRDASITSTPLHEDVNDQNVMNQQYSTTNKRRSMPDFRKRMWLKDEYIEAVRVMFSKEPNSDVIRDSILACVDSVNCSSDERVVLAKSIRSLMRRNRISPNCHHFNAWMKVFLLQGSNEDMEECWRQMEALDLIPNSTCYHLMIQFRMREGNHEAATELIDKMKYLGIAHHPAVYAKRASGADSTTVKAIMDEMASFKLKFGPLVYTSLLHALSREGNIIEARAVLEEILSRDIAADGHVLTPLILHYMEREDTVTILGLLRIGVSSHNKRANLWKKYREMHPDQFHRLSKIRYFFPKSLNDGIQIEQRSLHALRSFLVSALFKCPAAGDIMSAEGIIELFSTLSLEAPESAYHCLLRTYMKAGDVDACIKFLKRALEESSSDDPTSESQNRKCILTAAIVASITDMRQGSVVRKLVNALRVGNIFFPLPIVVEASCIHAGAGYSKPAIRTLALLSKEDYLRSEVKLLKERIRAGGIIPDFNIDKKQELDLSKEDVVCMDFVAPVSTDRESELMKQLDALMFAGETKDLVNWFKSTLKTGEVTSNMLVTLVNSKICPIGERVQYYKALLDSRVEFPGEVIVNACRILADDVGKQAAIRLIRLVRPADYSWLDTKAIISELRKGNNIPENIKAPVGTNLKQATIKSWEAHWFGAERGTQNERVNERGCISLQNRKVELRAQHNIDDNDENYEMIKAPMKSKGLSRWPPVNAALRGHDLSRLEIKLCDSNREFLREVSGMEADRVRITLLWSRLVKCTNDESVRPIMIAQSFIDWWTTAHAQRAPLRMYDLGYPSKNVVHRIIEALENSPHHCNICILAASALRCLLPVNWHQELQKLDFVIAGKRYYDDYNNGIVNDNQNNVNGNDDDDDMRLY